MANKTPIRAVFNDSNVATGLAEFQSGDTVALTHGGLGVSLSIGSAGQVLKVNSGASALEFGNVEAIVNIDGATDKTGATLATTDLLLASDGGSEGRVTLAQLDTLFSGTSKTLTNKTLTAPTISTPAITGNTTTTGSFIFEGSTADSFETTLTVTDPTADRTITIPNVTGTIVTTGDTGSVTNTMLAGSIAASKLAGSIGNSKLSNSSITVSDGSNTSAVSLGGTLTFAGTSNEVTVAEDSGTVTVSLPDNVTIGGNMTVTGNLTVSGSTTTVDSTTVSIQNAFVFEGATADSFETTLSTVDPTADRTILLPNASDTLVGKATTDTLTNKTIALGSNSVSGTLAQFNSAVSNATLVSTTGSETLTNKTLTSPTVNSPSIATPTVSGLTLSDSSIVFEGSTADSFETTLTVTDPTADRTLTLPNATDTLVGKATTDTLTNKSIDLGSNTLTGSLAEFNAALQSESFASLTGSETLTNKTLTSPVINNPTITGMAVNAASFTFEGSTADSFETTLTVVDPTADRTITLPNATGTVALIAETQTLTNKSIDLANNTLTGSVAEFNSALQSDSFATLAGSNTLTNKTLTSPIINTPTVGTSLTLLEDAVMIFEGATNDSFETTLTVVDPTADRTVSLPNATDTLVGKATTDTLTNKSIDSDNNTITNLVNADIKSSAAIEFSKMENLTASRALVSDGSGDVSVSAVTSTEIGHLDGVSSNIQTQLDTKTTAAFAIAQAVALG